MRRRQDLPREKKSRMRARMRSMMLLMVVKFRGMRAPWQSQESNAES